MLAQVGVSHGSSQARVYNLLRMRMTSLPVVRCFTAPLASRIRHGGASDTLLLLDPHLCQVHTLHKGFDTDTQAKEDAQRLAAFLRQLASAEQPGCPITILPTEPFKDAEGQVGRQGRPADHVAPRSPAHRLVLWMPARSPPAAGATPCLCCTPLPCAGLFAAGCGSGGRRHAVCCRAEAHAGRRQPDCPAGEVCQDQVGRLAMIASRQGRACRHPGSCHVLACR